MRRMLAVPAAALTLMAAAAIPAAAAPAATPRVALFPSSVTFGSQPVGSVQQRSVSVENVGNATLHVHSVVLNDYSGSYSLVFNTCGGATLAPGQMCQFTIQFHPRAPGQHSASAMVGDDAPEGTQSVPIWGTATSR
ncbi:MAG: hypothetical protein JWM18_4307 [Chloroflexi bacterium]|jgi:hypothetical protein|nr:hypothetical protein [Chloroflexota bacterium]